MNAIAKDSKAVLFFGPDRPWELRTMQTPEPQGHEILVKVLACTLCGSDLHSIAGKRAVHVPCVLGHEIVGQIDVFGPEAAHLDANGQPLLLGDRVVWSVVASCGACFYCRRGLPQKCERGFKYGHQAHEKGRGWSGGFAEHCTLVRGTHVVRLPDSISLAAACPLGCATSTIAAAMRQLNVQSGESVLVIGAGMLGLTACAMARQVGAQRVVCLERSEQRRELALQFGATHVLAPEDESAVCSDSHQPNHQPNHSHDPGVDVAIECTGNNSATAMALTRLRMGGRIALVGAVFPSEPASLVWERIVRRQITLIGIHNYTVQDLVSAVDFMERAHRDYPFASIVGPWFSLERFSDALDAARDAKHLRVAIAPKGDH